MQIEQDINRVYMMESSDIKINFGAFKKGEDLNEEDTLRNIIKRVQENTSLFLDMGEEKIYFDEQLLVYQKLTKVFSDLAKIQQKAFYNETEKDSTEDMDNIWNASANALEGVYDAGFDLLQKSGIRKYSKEEFIHACEKKFHLDL